MKAAPLLVAWHDDNAPIYSAHFEPHGKGRLATAGGDNKVRVSNTLYTDRPMQYADHL
jgi:chromatin assembly factor 1 subunit B